MAFRLVNATKSHWFVWTHVIGGDASEYEP